MKQIRVTSPFLDITCSNKRREVGDIFLATQERAAYLVSGQLCEYVKDEDENKETPQTPANGEQNGQQNGQQTEEQTADNGSTVAPADGEEQQSEEQQQTEGEGESAKDETPAEEQQQTDGEQPTDEGKATETKKTTKSKKEKK